MFLTGRHTDGVFRVKFSGGTGTAFLHYTPQGCCFLSAKHIFTGGKAGDVVEVQRDTGWASIRLSEIIHAASDDLCAFASDDFVMANLVPPFNEPQTPFGAEMLFAGFPHHLVVNYVSQGYPHPLIRGARFSGIIEDNGVEIMILDGFNNPGYSGSPIYSQNFSGEVVLTGVISGYLFEHISHGKVYQRDTAGNFHEIPNLYVRPNSGMINAVPYSAILDLMPKVTRFNPVRPDPTP